MARGIGSHRRTMTGFILTSVASAATSTPPAARVTRLARSCFVASSAKRPSNLLGTGAIPIIAAYTTSSTRRQRVMTPSPTTRLYGSNKRERQQQQQATRPSYRRRQADKKAAEATTTTNGELNWEFFDFSDNPKLDKRFGGEEGGDIRNLFDGGQDFSEVVQSEAAKDEVASQRLDDVHDAYISLDPTLVADATAAVEPYINPTRIERIDTVLAQRTSRSRFLFENPSNPSNVWACLRTIDSFGIQHVDVIVDSDKYLGKMAITQKVGMRAAMGSAKWLSLRNHPDTAEAVRNMKEGGYLIYASDLNPSSVDVREVDWDAGKICVVMGNEERGISDEMRNLADLTFTLPMSGFAESFNLSVATSITLAHMSAKSADGRGPLRPGDLDEHEYDCLRLKGLLQSLPQKRMGKSLLKQKGIELPSALDLI